MNMLGESVTTAQPLVDQEARWQRAVEIALTLGEFSLVYDLCGAIRGSLPQHLDARYYEARLAMARDDLGRARPVLEQLLQSDPEHWPARWALGALFLRRGDSETGVARCREAVARGSAGRSQDSLDWQPLLPLAPPLVGAEEQRAWEEAAGQLSPWIELDDAKARQATPDDPPAHLLRSTLLLDSLWRAREHEKAQELAQQLVAEHPQLVKAQLLLATRAAAEGDVVRSTMLLHDARVADPGGRVARRLRLPLLTLAFSSPLPAAVSLLLQNLPPAVHQALERGEGWQAPVGLPRPPVATKRARHEPSASPVLDDIQQELNRIRLQVDRHVPKTVRTDLVTAEAIVVAREPLKRLYGDAAAQAIIEELGNLAATVEKSQVVRPHLLVLDDAATLVPWNLATVDPSNAARVKVLLDQMDIRMEEGGEQLAYVLLVGGHEIIPHHRLPNPVDDQDIDVPSDNPYGAQGDNYLIPSRAVGRLPHERESPELLLSQIRALREAWSQSNLMGKGLISDWLAHLRQRVPAPHRSLPPGESWGMAAQVWHRAAEAVFRTLDRQTELTLCPPVTAGQWDVERPPGVPFYYFNLHGVEDGASWYGQVDPKNPTGGEAYPVALTPLHLHDMSLRGAVLFSEACYGANPHVYRAADSMALSAIRQGCSLFIGSTKIAYASFAPPLMAADLLAALFWKAIAEGAPGGVALQQAKVQLAESMMRRNGYLDVEEQKTLTSFILYGDPALPLMRRPRYADPEALRQLAAKTQQGGVYQVSGKSIPTLPLEPSVLQAVRAFTEPYLQGSRGSLNLRSHPVALSTTPPALAGQPARGNAQAKRVEQQPGQWHVTVSSTDEERGVVHQQVLTLTVNKHGKVLRTHISR